MEILIIYILLINFLFCVISENTIYSLFWLIFFFFNSFVFLFILKIKILAILILIIYVGAIAILFLFSIMILNLSKKVIIKNNFIFYFLPLFFIILYQLHIFEDFNIFYSLYSQLEVINYTFTTFQLGLLLYFNHYNFLLFSSILLLLPMIIVIIIL